MPGAVWAVAPATVLAVVCCALSGCGVTTPKLSTERGPHAGADAKPDAGADAEPDAAPDAAEIDPLDPCVERPPLTEPAENCAYPVAPLADPPRLESASSLSASDCRQYRLGEAIELPPLEAGTRYAFSFDVNGDSVADIFYWDSNLGVGLLASRISGGRVSYEPASCIPMPVDEYPGAGLFGRFFARDINHDSIPDVVLGHGHFEAFANLPGGLVKVMQARASNDARSAQMSFLSMAALDFDGDGHCMADLALGYDVGLETQGAGVGIEVGALLLHARGSWPQLSYESQSWAGQLSLEGGGEDLEYSGHLAASEQNGRALLFVQGWPEGAIVDGKLLQWRDGLQEEREIEFEDFSEFPSVRQAFREPWILPFAEKPFVLAVQQERELVLFDLSEPGKSPLPVLLRHPLVGSSAIDHVGGGGAVHPAGFMIDAEGDGDLDFIEETYTAEGDGTLIVIHRNESGVRFADGVAVELPVGYEAPAGVSEHPFVAAGGAQGAFLVGIEDYDNTPRVLWPIECVP